MTNKKSRGRVYAAKCFECGRVITDWFGREADAMEAMDRLLVRSGERCPLCGVQYAKALLISRSPEQSPPAPRGDNWNVNGENKASGRAKG